MYLSPQRHQTGHAGPFRPVLPTPFDQVIKLISTEYRISIPLIMHNSRCRAKTARARQLAMYLSHVVLGQSLTSIGIVFHRDRTTVSYACGLIEDLRDDPEFDGEVCRLETLLEGEGAANGFA